MSTLIDPSPPTTCDQPVDNGRRLDLRSLPDTVRHLLRRFRHEHEALEALVELTRKLTNAQAVACMRGSEAGFETVALSAASAAGPELLSRCAAEGEQCVALRAAGVTALAGGTTLITVPVAASSQRALAIAAVLRLSSGPVEPFLLLLELIASELSFWQHQEHLRQHEAQVRLATTILDVVSAIAAASDVKAAARNAATAVNMMPGCRWAAVGMCRQPGMECRVLAVSDCNDPDLMPTEEQQSSLEAVLNEAVLQQELVVLARGERSSRPLLAAHWQFMANTRCLAIISAPITDYDQNVIGSWIAVMDAPVERGDAIVTFLQSGGEVCGQAFLLLQAAEAGRWLTRTRKRLAAFTSSWTRVVACAAALVACLLLPIPLPVYGPVRMEPTVHRFVAVPHDGVFEQSLVAVGDVVHADQLLGRMDSRELRLELSSLQSEQARAAKSRDVNLAGGKVAAAQIDRLEVERIESRRRLLESRMHHLEIHSPIDGVVLVGDLERSAGSPVKAGEVLYEIGPLTEMVAEIAVPDSDIQLVDEGMPVSIRLDAYPGRAWTGKVVRVHPRAEIRNDVNVFICEVELENADHELRPGMQGRARIRSHWRPLLWIGGRHVMRFASRWLGV